MDKHIVTADLKAALKDHSKYQLGEINPQLQAVVSVVEQEITKSWIAIYKPIVLIFGYIIATTLLGEMTYGEFAWMRWMNNFMADFLLFFIFQNAYPKRLCRKLQ
jgi:hypothetical protein